MGPGPISSMGPGPIVLMGPGPIPFRDWHIIHNLASNPGPSWQYTYGDLVIFKP